MKWAPETANYPFCFALAEHIQTKAASYAFDSKGKVAAVQAQKWIERSIDRRRRKERYFGRSWQLGLLVSHRSTSKL